MFVLLSADTDVYSVSSYALDVVIRFAYSCVSNAHLLCEMLEMGTGHASGVMVFSCVGAFWQVFP